MRVIVKKTENDLIHIQLKSKLRDMSMVTLNEFFLVKSEAKSLLKQLDRIIEI